eukprot:TRINITY_DN704_c1_g1_i1.p1 TRINITY_DN704_c1_g1~~TRINITY_DN704_c1_g1_i1.p1  ORF type:complete len:145 (-),score=34.09 TRINITY_DN704_c1_g1_i1:109-543(-)
MEREEPNQYEIPDRIDVVVSEVEDKMDESGKILYTSYKLTTNTNLPNYKTEHFSVRRRYSDFENLRNYLVREVENNKKTKGSLRRVPELPGKKLLGRFDPSFIETRRKSLEEFLNRVANHAICRMCDGFHKFIEDQDFDTKTLL